MYKLICVTQRSKCNDFLNQIKKINQTSVDSIILREKDLNEEQYKDLAIQLQQVTSKLVIHTYYNVAIQLDIPYVHVPLSILQTMEHKEYFKEIGASIHSLEEAKQAQRLGATYITAGHIFQTDCKKDLKPRGLQYLENIHNHINIPVYGIGGIHPSNIKSVLQVSDGVCIMSDWMKYDPQYYEKQLKKAIMCQ